MHMALNNAANVNPYYKAKAEQVQIEVVAYGPGLMMLHAAKSPVKKRIIGFGQNFDNISFRACGNTHRNEQKGRKKGRLAAPGKISSFWGCPYDKKTRTRLELQPTIITPVRYW